MRRIKEFVKCRPRLYDMLNARRPLVSETEKWIDDFSRHSARPLTFIQVGANDGLRWDPFRRFIVRDAWSGALVEPVPAVFRMLRRNYAYLDRGRLRFINALIADSGSGHLPLWVIDETHLERLEIEAQLFWLRKSSLSREHLLRHAGMNELPESLVVAVDVPTTSLTDVVARELGGATPDIVLSDAEGFDDSVIYSLDLETHRPRALVFEAHSLGDRMEPLVDHLGQHGYSVARLGGDAVATRRSGN